MGKNKEKTNKSLEKSKSEYKRTREVSKKRAKEKI